MLLFQTKEFFLEFFLFFCCWWENRSNRRIQNIRNNQKTQKTRNIQSFLKIKNKGASLRLAPFGYHASKFVLL